MHPEIDIVSRNRCGLYAQGARQDMPEARQVADRFYLLQNLRDTVEQQMSRPQFQRFMTLEGDGYVSAEPQITVVRRRRPRLPGQVQQDEAAHFKRTPSQVKPSQVKSSQAKPSQAKPASIR